MAHNSRVGKSIARRACDLCRDRRVQCSFNDGASACRRCLDADAPCTFLTPTRPRGPASKRVAEARQRAAASTQSPQPPKRPPGLPLTPVSSHDFLPEATFNAVLDDFLLRVYPVLPIIHITDFNQKRSQRLYESDPSFLRICLALCSVTVASIPRNVAADERGELKYGGEWYASAAEMVMRASHLVLVSRLSADPNWQNDASVESMVVSVVLSMASHYVGKANMGWAYASEAIHFFRELELYKASAYHNLSMWDAEICKRSFWLLFIIQVHDRISFTIPHTGLSYDPQQTDWEFLMPLEIHDHDMDDSNDAAQSRSKTHSTPLISGFIALIKVFICVVDILDKTFPGPPQYFNMSHGDVASRLLDDPSEPRPYTAPSGLPQLEVLLQVMTRLEHILADVPLPLRLPQRGGQDHYRDGIALDASSHHFEIMRANIHITAIYFQSLILEICLNRLGQDSSSPSDAALVQDGGFAGPLLQMKESVARELLDIISCSSPMVIESNGSSMIKKIREIAATFLDDSSTLADGNQTDDELRRSNYIRKFVEILADLDYIQQ